MQGQGRVDTTPELAVRKLVWAAGYRYRVDARPLPEFRRRADLVFRREKLAVFVDGCFWHGCHRHVSWPKKNSRWWAEKIQRNRERDRDTSTILRRAGWTVLRVWEHEKATRAAERIIKELQSLRDAG
jgi:DNA mismatch endonuclease (patch repair protein)